MSFRSHRRRAGRRSRPASTCRLPRTDRRTAPTSPPPRTSRDRCTRSPPFPRSPRSRGTRCLAPPSCRTCAPREMPTSLRKRRGCFRCRRCRRRLTFDRRIFRSCCDERGCDVPTGTRSSSRRPRTLSPDAVVRISLRQQQQAKV